MTDDLEAKATKRGELTTLAMSSGCSQFGAELVVDAFARIDPPSQPSMTTELIVLSAGDSRPRAVARRPGRIILNFRNLFETLAEGTLGAAGAVSLTPWLAALSSIYILNGLWKRSSEDLSSEHASVLLALWRSRDSRNEISSENGLIATLTVCAEFGIQSMSPLQYERVVTSLAKMKCIELTAGRIWLREWIRVNY